MNCFEVNDLLLSNHAIKRQDKVMAIDYNEQLIVFFKAIQIDESRDATLC